MVWLSPFPSTVHSANCDRPTCDLHAPLLRTGEMGSATISIDTGYVCKAGGRNNVGALILRS